jgi:hypothetical protein
VANDKSRENQQCATGRAKRDGWRFEACPGTVASMEGTMNGIIYIVGLIVVVMFILSFLGLR